jgi:phosphatidate cytidylyltransferase
MIPPTAQERLFKISNAFDNPTVRFLVIGLAVVLALTPLFILALTAAGALSDKLKKDLWDRYLSWLLFIPMMFGPVLLGAAWVILGVCILALFCYNEFARATGMFRDRVISAMVVIGILAMTSAVADAWYGFFTAIPAIMVGLMAAAAILADQPKGYIQRLALGIVAFMIFGVCCAHLGYFANHPHYRPILLWLIGSVELNDIFAYITGKSFGRRKLAPNTSPNKTIGGAVGALILTTLFAASLGHWVFAGTRMDQPAPLILAGLIISLAGQFGDLTLSSIKRDLGIKDWSNTFPGHGGLLDRFNSLLFAAPATFHFVAFILHTMSNPAEERWLF